jgi:hypothetical protein
MHNIFFFYIYLLGSTTMACPFDDIKGINKSKDVWKFDLN